MSDEASHTPMGREGGVEWTECRVKGDWDEMGLRERGKREKVGPTLAGEIHCHTLSRVLRLSRGPPLAFANMLSLLSRRLSSRPTLFSNPAAVQTASLAIARKNRAITEAVKPTHDDTDPADAASNSAMAMDHITNILDKAPPQSDNFSSKPFVAHSRPDAQCPVCP
jgi:hypothetical protein